MLETILPILWIHLLAVMSPWPSTIVVIQNSLKSRKYGFWTAIWIWIGEMVHVIYSIAWLGFIISQSILALNVIKVLWWLYLMYLWYKWIMSKWSDIASNQEEIYTGVSIWQSIKEWFLTGALNPKATVFFVSLFSLVVSPDMPFDTLVVLGIFICIDCILRFAGLSYFISIPAIRNGYARIGKYIDKFFGVFLVWFGIKLLTTKMR